MRSPDRFRSTVAEPIPAASASARKPASQVSKSTSCAAGSAVRGAAWSAAPGGGLLPGTGRGSLPAEEQPADATTAAARKRM